MDSIIVSNTTDSSFALGVAYNYGQTTDISDIISLTTFANTEFCPTFLTRDYSSSGIGNSLRNKTVYIVSTTHPSGTRTQLAASNILISAAAKENGAEKVILIEPDLFFSAQDRGPHSIGHPQMTSDADRKKFDGQPFSAKVYAEILRKGGVDQVVTIHNHKPEVLNNIYNTIFHSEKLSYVNMDIYHVVASFLLTLIDSSKKGSDVCFVAPDEGASSFVSSVCKASNLSEASQITLKKERSSQRDVVISSDEDLSIMKDKTVFILDDMVRTGMTISSTIDKIASDPYCRPAKIFFYCTHTYMSAETRRNLNSKHLTEFITTNTMPNVLNRDDQGRLRKRMIVIKIEKWVAHFIKECLEKNINPSEFIANQSIENTRKLYSLDYSSHNIYRS